MQEFQKFLEGQKKYQYIQEGDRILVAFSGGPDSVFLVASKLTPDLCSPECTPCLA